MKTATATITISIDGVPKTFSAAGETDGSVHRLARRLAQAVSGDAQMWSLDEGAEAELQADRAARADRLGRDNYQIGLDDVVEIPLVEENR